MTQAGKEVQRKAQEANIKGTQKLLVPLKKKEQVRQRKNYLGRLRTRMNNYCTNFYVLDTETSGLTKDGGKNEPIQIVALLYRNGIRSEYERYNKYFIPQSKMTWQSIATHGLTEGALES